MLKTRIIAVLVVKQGIVVQSIGFKKFLPVGNPSIAIDFLNRWGIDEIILLDIDATRLGRKPSHDMMKTYTTKCHVPLTVGGGIKDVKDMEDLIRSGADKVSINASAVISPEIITQGAKILGSQCIVVSMDAKQTGDNQYEVFTHSGKFPVGKTPSEMAKIAEDKGAGEILLNSIDRDGSGKGYDLKLIEQVMNAVKIPVIACGGVKHPAHFLEAMKLDVPGVAAANFFHYSEHSVITVKRFLVSAGANVRLDSYADYKGFQFDGAARVLKQPDQNLEKLRFEYIPEEVI